jgi:predicted RNase H-like nuclease (RuvC/YqgF family)
VNGPERSCFNPTGRRAIVPKYHISAEFSLVTEIEPEGIRFDGDAEDFQDGSYFSGQSVTSDGGQVTFTVEAEDEDRAREKSEADIFDGMEVEDHNGFTWVVENLNVEVEKAEWEPTVEEAVAVLEDFVSNYATSENELHSRVAIAAGRVLTEYDSMRNRVTSLEARITESDERITALSARLQELDDQLQGRTTVPSA